MKLNHALMDNNFTKSDMISVINLVKKKNIILTQSKKVKEFEKKELSKSITNHKIDELYKTSIQNGALGGKLLGAGGGGFLLIYMVKEKQNNFLKKIKNITNIPFKFSNKGCEVILNSLKK